MFEQSLFLFFFWGGGEESLSFNDCLLKIRLNASRGVRCNNLYLRCIPVLTLPLGIS